MLLWKPINYELRWNINILLSKENIETIWKEVWNQLQLISFELPIYKDLVKSARHQS